MYKEDYQLLEDFRQTRNIKHETLTGYKSTLNIYTKLNHKSFTSMIREAEREEKQQIRWKERKIRKRLITFRTYLLNQEYLVKTVKEYLQRIQTLYTNYEIELRPLPHISEKSFRRPSPVTYEDLPSKDLLRKIVLLSNPLQSAFVVFMISSGCAKKETLSLKIQDFIDATRPYHNSNNIYEVLDVLQDRKNVVPMWKVYRSKTGKYYFTFSSSESVEYIVAYLLSRKDVLSGDKNLFKINDRYFSTYFSEMNDKLDLGYAGSYRKFRSHVLRKFHASALYNDGMSLDIVNELQGKSKNRTDSAYFMINPNILRNEYVKHMGVVSVMGDVVLDDFLIF